ncbi:MAG: hypothetical protein FWE57_01335 [Chitinispirillia bacterium]|nr:hypothetical protein [Chitinispirillia bacterium]
MFQTEDKFRRLFPHVFALIILAACASYGQFRETRQLTSNNIISLAGNGDTVWIATDRGLNYQTSLDDKREWRGFEADNFIGRFYGLGFGGGGAAALLGGEVSSPSVFSFWHFDHKSGKSQQHSFRFSKFTGELRETAAPAGGVIFFDNKFWAPFKDGGMICYDPAVNKAESFRPDTESGESPENLSPPDGRNSEAVLSVAVIGDSLLVTTPSKLWYYDNQSKTWSDVLDGDSDIESNEEFLAAFTLNGGLYSFVNIRNNGKADTVLYRLSDGNKWHKALNNTPRAVFPAVQGYFYALFEKNEAAVFLDGEEKFSAGRFRNLLANAGDNSDPIINDILFLPNKESESKGTLIIATSSGLYFTKSANPLTNDYPDMVYIRHIRQIKPGESYALPGIIRGDGFYGRAVFVYKLKKNGNVTIRVYDYNMSHVKTVVSGARRLAQTPGGRSTDPAVDFWDGTNKAGRKVSPGVYYYKITSTGGDRFHGKVILAK